jgi:hypothetical protein
MKCDFGFVLKFLSPLLALSCSLLAVSARADDFKLNPTGMAGSAGAGIVLFHVQRPASNFRIDQGIYGAISGERGLGAMHLHLTLSLGYLTTKGQTNYNYSTLSGVNYTGTDVNYKVDLFQGGLGLKFKLLEESFFRPYIEAGGLAGYFKMSYTDIANKVVGTGTDYKSDDALLDFGYYGEGGVEISFTEQFGLRVAARWTKSQTKEFETLGNSRIDYTSEVYYLSVLKQF